MGHDSRDLNQGLDTTEGLSQSEELGGRGEDRGSLGTTGDSERNHTTSKTVTVLLENNRVSGVRLETRVVDSNDGLVLGQVLGNLLGGESSLSDSQVQGLETSVGQPGVKWRRHRANGVLQETVLLVQLVVVGGQDTANHVGVTVDVLGDGVDNNVSTVHQWVGNVWGQEGVVDDQDGVLVVLLVVLLDDFGDSRDVGHRQGWVGWSLEPHKLGALTERGLQVLLQVVNKLNVKAVGVGDLGEVTVSTTIDITTRNNVGANRQGLENQGGSGRSGSNGNGMLGLLQGSNGGLEVVSVWVTRSGVVVDTNGLRRLQLSESGTEGDGLDDSSRVWVDRGTSVDGSGAEAVVSVGVDGHCVVCDEVVSSWICQRISSATVFSPEVSFCLVALQATSMPRASHSKGKPERSW